MKGVILAGGTGSRLRPLTKVTNKHLLPVGHAPMIFHPISKLVQAGIGEILVVTGYEHMGKVIGQLGSGKNFRTPETHCQLTFRVQDEAGGIAQALSLAENFSGGSKLVVLLGDNIFEDSLTESVAAFAAQKSGARVLLKEVPDPSRFGVAKIDQGKIVSIEEKPANPASRFAVTGMYFYDSDVFDIIRPLKPSAKRQELEITDVNNAYLNRGALEFDILKGWWSDAGTFKSYYQVNKLVFASPNQDIYKIMNFDSHTERGNKT